MTATIHCGWPKKSMLLSTRTASAMTVDVDQIL